MVGTSVDSLAVALVAGLAATMVVAWAVKQIKKGKEEERSKLDIYTVLRYLWWLMTEELTSIGASQISV